MAAIAAFEVGPPYQASVTFANGRPSQKLSSISSPGWPQSLGSEDVPSEAVLRSAHKIIPEFVPINAKLAVSSEARDLIENLEPGLHQFFPVKIRRERGTRPILRRDGMELSEPYYVVNIRTRLDAVDIEKSDVIVTSNANGRPDLLSLTYKGEDRLVLRREIITGHHLWRGCFQLPLQYFLSDVLAHEFMVRNWKGLKITSVREE